MQKNVDSNSQQLSSEKLITLFYFSSAKNPILSTDIFGTIDQINKTIIVTLPAGVSPTNLKASFTISEKASSNIAGIIQQSDVTINDFTNTIIYTIKAEDNSTQNYSVSVVTTVVSNFLTNFSFSPTNNPSLTSVINATINQSNKSINIIFPEGLDLSNLKASYVVESNATVRVSGAVQTNSVTPNNFSSVKKYDITSTNNITQSYTINATVNTSGPNIYVAGEAENGIRVWKNGIATNLYNTSNQVRVKDIYATSTDVFVVGSEESGNGYKIAKLWQNGSSINLSQLGNDAEATAVYVNGSDVYVVGAEKVSPASPYNVAKLWKNGIATTLTSLTSAAFANDVFVTNGDVYVVGGDFNNSPFYAWVWKNGVLSNLTNFNRIPVSVSVSNNDVYILGGDNGNDISIWKNGTITRLGDVGYTYECLDIETSGADVYYSALKKQVGSNSRYVYFKNGIENATPSSLVIGGGFDLKISGQDVYYNGTAIISMPPFGSNYKAQLWKNGQSIGLNHSPQFANYGKCIFIQ
jgi:hypothetical protein